MELKKEGTPATSPFSGGLFDNILPKAKANLFLQACDSFNSQISYLDMGMEELKKAEQAIDKVLFEIENRKRNIKDQ